MFQLLLSSAHCKLRAFQFPVLCQQAGEWEARREQGQDSWPEQDKKIFHSTECHVQYRGVGRKELIAAQVWAAHWSVGGNQLYCASLVFSIVFLLHHTVDMRKYSLFLFQLTLPYFWRILELLNMFCTYMYLYFFSDALLIFFIDRYIYASIVFASLLNDFLSGVRNF